MTARPVRARKALGQHWLVDPRALKRIAAAVAATPAGTVVEVGPGTGRLTGLLAHPARRLIAVELDETLGEHLRQRFSGSSTVSVLNADVLKVSPADILQGGGGAEPYVVVGNLPYYVGTAIVRHFLYGEPPPQAMIVMLQAEVAESIAAPAGERGYLSLMVQAVAQAKVLFHVPPSAFRPAPKVRSAVVRLDLRDPPLIAPERAAAFLEFAQAGFAAPRKNLRNSLAIGLRVTPPEAEMLLDEAGIPPGVRPAVLEITGWVCLFDLWTRQQAS